MNRDEMAVFVERLGHRVVRTESCYWYDLRPRFFLAFPHFRPVSPSVTELKKVLADAHCMGVRFPSPLDAQGRRSYALALDNRLYDLDCLSANTRSKVRRGLKQCEIHRLEPAFVRSYGRTANADTLERMRFQKDPYDWDRYWDAIHATAGAEVWGAIRQKELLAYLVVVVVGGDAEIPIERSRNDGLRYYPNNALVFAVAKELINRPEIERILFGLESLEPVVGVDQFKESMGFRRCPIRQRIVFHPCLEWLAKRSLFRQAVQRMARRTSQNEFWRKLEGLLIFHKSSNDQLGTLEEASWTW